MTLTKSEQHREGYVWRCKNANCNRKSCKKTSGKVTPVCLNLTLLIEVHVISIISSTEK